MGLKRGGKPKQSGPAAPQERIFAFSSQSVNAARHQTLRVTPAMQPGISNHVWNLDELLT